MMRLVAALAVASFSAAAVAAPPTLAPVDVKVVNQPLTVTPLEHTTELMDMRTAVGRVQFPAGNTTTVTILEAAEDVVLRGVTIDLDANAAPVGGSLCRGIIAAQDANEGPYRMLVEINGSAGTRDGHYVPLPNIRLPAGYKLAMLGANQTLGFCMLGWSVIATKL